VPLFFFFSTLPATVDGILDQKPSKIPCKRNPPVIPPQLSSAQKQHTAISLSPSIGSS
jgi:hypothetical protein